MATRQQGSKAPTSPHPSLHRTVFLVPNLHCPSCASHIKSSLLSLYLKLSSISYSIVSYSVTVYHDPSLLVSTISKALEEVGYEVYSVILDSSSTDIPLFSNVLNGGSRGPRGQWFERAIRGWKTKGGRLLSEEEKKRKRHIEHCDLCRAKEKVDVKEILSSSSTEHEKVP
jgi:copper chaperone CopZ